MEQMTLIQPRIPPKNDLIDLRCCSNEDPQFLADAQGAALVIADPNWKYDQRIAEKAAEDHYTGDPIEVQIRRLNAFRAAGCKLLALWLTEPIEAEFDAVAYGASKPGCEPLHWGGHVTGGSWHKEGVRDTGHYGSGWWTSGTEEPWRLYTNGGKRHSAQRPRNGWIEPAGAHSRKPSRYMAQWIRCWTAPGSLIVVPFAGLGGEIEAVLLAGEGRRCLAAEIDPARHGACAAIIAQVRT